jgi:hypothetical protein
MIDWCCGVVAIIFLFIDSARSITCANAGGACGMSQTACEASGRLWTSGASDCSLCCYTTDIPCPGGACRFQVAGCATGFGAHCSGWGSNVLCCPNAPPPVDCAVGGWSGFSACSSECGGQGRQVRNRVVTVNAANGGAQCPPLSESQNCANNCFNCDVSQWTTFGGCSKSCGGGMQTRSRAITRQASCACTQCPSQLSETKACNEQACPIDCIVGPYGAYSPCTQCVDGVGKRMRSRNITTPAGMNGNP